MKELDAFLMRSKKILLYGRFAYAKNKIGNVGAKYISESIAENSTVEDIDISNNRIRADIRAMMEEQLNECILRKKRHYNTMICAFTKRKNSLLRLGFDKRF
jgi:hypothetical protein